MAQLSGVFTVSRNKKGQASQNHKKERLLENLSDWLWIAFEVTARWCFDRNGIPKTVRQWPRHDQLTQQNSFIIGKTSPFDSYLLTSLKQNKSVHSHGEW